MSAASGVLIIFDPATIKSTQLLGYTREHIAVYRVFYNNGSAEDMIDVNEVLKDK